MWTCVVMFEECRLPPLCRLMPLEPGADVAAETRRKADAGADPGTVLCATREDMLDCAVVLHPEVPLEQAQLVLYVAALGIGDALATIAPPMFEVSYFWPNRIDANLGSVAEVDILQPDAARPGSVPDWLAVHVTVMVGPLPEEVVRQDISRTSLRDEGCVELTVVELLETFARHFLTWTYRWQDDGFEPIRAMWLRHAPSHGEAIEIVVGGRRLEGKFEGIDEDGALILVQKRKKLRIGLDEALADRV